MKNKQVSEIVNLGRWINKPQHVQQDNDPVTGEFMFLLVKRTCSERRKERKVICHEELAFTVLFTAYSGSDAEAIFPHFF